MDKRGIRLNSYGAIVNIAPPLIPETRECIVCGEQVNHLQFKFNPAINYCKDNDMCKNIVIAVKKLDKQLKAEGTSFTEIANKIKK